MDINVYATMNIAAVTNALGDATVYEYDARGNRTYEGGATYPVRYTYDVYGNKMTMTTYRHEPERGGRGATALPMTGDTTIWLYDEPSGVMTNKIYADGKGPRYTYTDDGRLATRTWARGIVTAYVYDGWGNLIETAYSDDTPTVTVAYDAMGRQVEAHDAAGVTTFASDAYGANTNETVIGVAGTNTIERFTDAYGRDTGYALNGARQTILGYDEQTGRLATMQTSTQEVDNHHSTTTTSNYNSFVWTYHPGSDLKSQLAYPNGLTASWTYDANNQLLQVQNATPTNVVSQYDYAYDAAGRRIACSRSGDAMSVTDTIAYAYNARGELTNAVSNVDADYSYAYQYDDIGNRVSSAECGARSAEYVANELNQYTQIDTSTSALSCETFNPEFDDDGNQTLIRTATGEWRVTYNGENRPVLWTCLATTGTIATNGDTIVMSYDRQGRRVTKNAERFVYDGYLCVKKSEASTPIPYSLLPIHHYVWDPTEPIATRPLVWNSTTLNAQPATRFYTHDGTKNVSEVVEERDGEPEHYEYSPFGVIIVKRGEFAIFNPWRFSSEFSEDERGCHAFTFREYEPEMGRWMQRDPVRELSQTLYSFVDNDDSSYDYLGLLKFQQKKCDAVVSRCEAELNQIRARLEEVERSFAVGSPFDRSRKNRRTLMMSATVPKNWFALAQQAYAPRPLPNHWNRQSSFASKIHSLVAELKAGFRTEVLCCPPQCDDTMASSYVRQGENAGKILLCGSGIKSFDSYGGCGCLLLHELLHKYGFSNKKTSVYNTPERNAQIKQENRDNENGMIRIARLLTSMNCKGYDER